MNGLEIGLALFSIAIILFWLMTPDERVMSEQEKARREYETFQKALKEKWLLQQKEHGRRVEARRKANS